MPMSDRGDAYVAHWAQEMPRRIGLGPEYVSDAMLSLGFIDWDTAVAIREPLKRGEAIPAVGSLEGPQAKAVILKLIEIDQRLEKPAPTHCSGCGLPLGRNGECKECV